MILLGEVNTSQVDKTPMGEKRSFWKLQSQCRGQHYDAAHRHREANI